MDDLPRLIAEAYRWQRRLGATSIATPYCGIVAAPQRPDVWDSNHADEVVAKTDADADAVFAAMDHHLSHTRFRWRSKASSRCGARQSSCAQWRARSIGKCCSRSSLPIMRRDEAPPT